MSNMNSPRFTSLVSAFAFLALLTIVVTPVARASSNDVLDQQTTRDILIKFLQSTAVHVPWIRSDYWGTDASYCMWFGVTCAEGTETVVGISLPGNSLSGTIPSVLCNLTSIQHLDLSSNFLLGGQLPLCLLGNITDLQTLNVSSCTLESVSGDLSTLSSNLYSIDLSQNEELFAGGSSMYFFGEIFLTHDLLQYFSIAGTKSSGDLPTPTTRIIKGASLSIDFSDNDISGTLSADWFRLKNLSSLNLQNNRLTGSLPSLLDIPPSTLYVRYLKLANNAFLPSTSTSLVPFLAPIAPRLFFMDLSSNRFGGLDISNALPWNNFTSMSYLYLEDGGWQGQLDTMLSFPPKLEVFSIHGNKLSGALPAHICSSGAPLLVFNASSNSFTGEIPPQFGDCASLQTLDLQRNSLTGNVFGEWMMGLKNLSIFNVNINRGLGGTIPTYIGSLSSLTSMGMSVVGLTGTIPTEIGLMKNLRAIFLEFLGITGTLPTEIGAIDSLEIIMLDRLKISGTFPSEIAALPNLTFLSAASSNFHGTLPSYFGEMNASKMKSVNLFGNSFSGTLPTEWAAMPALQVLILSVNNLTGTKTFENMMIGAIMEMLLCDILLCEIGTLPTEFGNCRNLNTFYVSEQNMSGTIPTEYGNWENIVEADLSHNGLHGEIPTEIGQWSQLRLLALYGNLFTGTIPSEFGLLQELSLLYLGENPFLKGTIPSFLASLPNLADVDLHHTGLSGTVPAIAASRYVDLSSMNIEDDISYVVELLFRSGPSVINLSNNPGVTGKLLTEEILVSLPSSTTFSFVIAQVSSLLLSNCSISGTISSDFFLDVLSMMEVLDLSHNPNVSGALPMTWIRESTAIKSINVNGTSVREDPSDPVQFIPGTVVPYGDGSYACQQIDYGKPGVQVIGVSPEYFGFRNCHCVAGYVGSVPHCVPAAHSTDWKVIGSVSGTLGLCLIVSTYLLVRRRLRKQRNERKANRLLAEYALHMGDRQKRRKGDSDGTSSRDTGDEYVVMMVAPHEADQWTGELQLDPQFIIQHKQLEILRTIAHGASGVVSLATYHNTQVAVKEFYPSMDMKNKDFIAETSIHAKLRHPNVVLLIGMCMEPLVVVTEFLVRGSLYHNLHSTFDAICKSGRRKAIAMDIARGMLYLHSRGVLHRDLKSLNVLLDDHWTAKVADFGAAKAAHSTMTQGMGTVAWMAPEVFHSSHYTEKCDVYSFGIVLWELVTGDVPFADINFEFEIQDAVQAGRRPEISQECGCASWCSELITHCLDGDPTKRPTFEEIVAVLSNQEGDLCTTETD